MEMQERIAKFVEGAQKMIEAYNARQGFSNDRVLVANFGRKYVRIEQRPNASSPEGSAWAFIRLEDGAIMKPDGWKRPAPQKRGSIMKEDFGVSDVGPYGPGYLR